MMEDEYDCLSGSILRQCRQRGPLDWLVLSSQANGAMESMFMARGEMSGYQAKPSEKSMLNAAMYRFWSDEEYNRVQAYLWTHGNYQLEAVSPCFIFLAR